MIHLLHMVYTRYLSAYVSGGADGGKKGKVVETEILAMVNE